MLEIDNGGLYFYISASLRKTTHEHTIFVKVFFSKYISIDMHTFSLSDPYHLQLPYTWPKPLATVILGADVAVFLHGNISSNVLYTDLSTEMRCMTSAHICTKL
jgi:hypothetical protein